MQPTEFFIPRTWRIKARIEHVYDVLSRPREFPRWWSEVYLAVSELQAGDAHGVGRVVALRTKGKLPYDWTVLATKPWMITLAPLLRPVFAWNHRWAMQRGFEGVTRELARRAAQ